MALFSTEVLNPGVQRRELLGWAMYDFANSGYTTVVITAVFAAYFVGGVAGGADWAPLAWTVALDEGRPFIGRAKLEAQKAAGAPRQMIGLVMDEKGVLRHGQKVLTPYGEGEILSGTFSPTLGKAIAFARVPAGDIALGAAGGVRVDIRGKEVPVRVVKFPFVRDGQAQPGVLE